MAGEIQFAAWYSGTGFASPLLLGAISLRVLYLARRPSAFRRPCAGRPIPFELLASGSWTVDRNGPADFEGPEVWRFAREIVVDRRQPATHINGRALSF